MQVAGAVQSLIVMAVHMGYAVGVIHLANRNVTNGDYRTIAILNNTGDLAVFGNGQAVQQNAFV